MNTYAGEVAQREAAEQAERSFPRWLVVWGVYSRQFVCFPKFDGGTVLSGRNLNQLAGRMRTIEGVRPVSCNDQRAQPIIYQASPAPPDVMCGTTGCRAQAVVRLAVPVARQWQGGPLNLDLCGPDFSRSRESVQRDGDYVGDTTGNLTDLTHEFPDWHLRATYGGRLIAADLQGTTVHAYLVGPLRAEIRRAMADADVWARSG